MECSTKVFGEGSLGIKAQMSTVTGCLVWAFPANNIKNAKKLSGGLGALNAATHGAVARAIESKDLDTASGSHVLLNATDAWAKLGLKADRLLLVCCGEEPKVKPKQGGNNCSKWISAGLKSLIATTAKDAVWVFDDFSAKDGLTQVRLLVQLAREQVYKFGARHPQFKTKPVEKSPSLKKLVIASHAKNNKAVTEAVAEGRAIANGMDLAKDLGNLPPNICNPTYLSTSAKNWVKSLA
jgi:leucyl aminopeptidase